MIEFVDGVIRTVLSDISFIELIYKKWSGYNEFEIEALMASVTSQEMTDLWLKDPDVGFDFEENMYFVTGNVIRLVKMKEKEWIVQDMSPEDMTTFVEKLNK